jgi:predicted RNA-binding Zn-ribbon protein involved in translation (DUF1610 family)
MTHELKIAPKYFEYVKDWSKPFELRKNDRNYQPGDIVILKEFSIISGIYSGRQAIRKISYVLKNCPEYGLDKDYCIIGFAFEPIADKPQGEWIEVTNGRGGHECNQCGEYAPSYQSGDEYLSKFCPNCGAKMVEPQESEDKE